MEKEDLNQKLINELCPNCFYEDDNVRIGIFKHRTECDKHPLGDILPLSEKGINNDKFKYFVVFSFNNYTSNRFICAIVNIKHNIISYYDANNKYPYWPSETLSINQKQIESIITNYLNNEKSEQTTIDVDIQKEAYDLSSKVFNFKELRRNVIEHGKLCYIEGYKKHAELFYTFLVKNGYFSEEELHKVQTVFDVYLNGKSAVSINTCEDLLQKIKPIVNRIPRDEGYPMPCLNSCQKEIVMYYCDTLTNDKRLFRIKKARQKGVSTILRIIAYLESQNEKKVLYIGGDDPSKRTGLKYNQNFKFLHSIEISNFIGKRYDLIIIDDPRNNKVLEHFHEILPCLSEEGKVIVALTPCNPDFYHYNVIKNFFKRDSASIFTYCTGKSDRADELIEKYPEFRNEMMGEFID